MWRVWQTYYVGRDEAEMSRLIDADLLKRIICEDQCEQPDGCGGSCEMTDYVENAPTIEAVNVVRCSECQYWQPPTHAEQEDGSTVGHCTAALNGQQTDAYWFCADGTR